MSFDVFKFSSACTLVSLFVSVSSSSASPNPVPAPAPAPVSVDSTPEIRQAFQTRANIGPWTFPQFTDRGPIATPVFVTTYVGFDAPYDVYVPAFEANLQAALQRWGSVLSGSGTITVSVTLDHTGAGGWSRSAFSGFYADRNGTSVYMQGWPYKQQTGDDANLEGADIEMVFNINDLTNELWLDPSPATRTEPVPFEKTDAISRFLSMLGPCAFINGWINAGTGEFPETYRSTFDDLVLWSADNPVFTGARARSVYNTIIFGSENLDTPLTLGRIYGVGNSYPGNGYQLSFELLFGSFMYRGVRYDISPLTVALADDTGLITRLPCPPDVNASGDLSVQDIFDFLAVWFTSGPRSDFNNDTLTSVQDIFDFLAAWFTGCV